MTDNFLKNNVPPCPSIDFSARACFRILVFIPPPLTLKETEASAQVYLICLLGNTIGFFQVNFKTMTHKFFASSNNACIKMLKNICYNIAFISQFVLTIGYAGTWMK